MKKIENISGKNESLKNKCLKLKWINFLSNHQAIILSVISSTIIAIIFGGLLVDKGMSPAEGWYSYYAKLVNEYGQLPYRDFELLFPPIYTYLIAFITKIFGYEIIVLRIVGVFVYIALAVLLNFIFYKLLKNAALSFVVGTLVFAYLQSEIVQISYDYIRFMDVSVYASLLAFLCFIDNKKLFSNENRKFIHCACPSIILSGTFAAFASLFKQSSGLIYLICMLAIMIIMIIAKKDSRLKIFYSLIWYLIPIVAIYGIMCLIMAVNGNLSNFIHYVYGISANSKGGLFTVLFGNVLKSLPSYLFMIIPTGIVLILIYVYTLSSRKYKQKIDASKKFNLLLILICVGISMLLILLSFFVKSVGYFLSSKTFGIMDFVFVFDFIIAIIYLVLVLSAKKICLEEQVNNCKYLTVSGSAFFLAYAVCMSGGLSQSQVALCLGVFACIILKNIKFIAQKIITTILCVIFIAYSTCCFASKITNIYSWWFMDLGDYWSQTYQINDIELLKGIKVNKTYYEMYTDVVKTIKDESKKEDTVFVFPHAPIFYLLTDRDSSTYTKVQWFDVTADKDIIKDIEKLKECLPKIILFIEVPQSVIEAHEQSFRGGEISGLSKMQNELSNIVSENNYKKLKSYNLNENENDKLYRLTLYKLI